MMNKLILIGILLLCVGCTEPRPRSDTGKIILTKEDDFVGEFEYKNHEYIRFGHGVEHDPNCRCFKK